MQNIQPAKNHFVPVATNRADVIQMAGLIAKRLAKRQAAFVRGKIDEYARLSVMLDAEGNIQVRNEVERRMGAICQVLETYLPKKARAV